jgi:hypothetical protein
MEVFVQHFQKCSYDTKLCFLKYIPSDHFSALQTNSVALVREQTLLIERPPLVGEVSVNFCGYRVL